MMWTIRSHLRLWRGFNRFHSVSACSVASRREYATHRFISKHAFKFLSVDFHVLFPFHNRFWPFCCSKCCSARTASAVRARPKSTWKLWRFLDVCSLIRRTTLIGMRTATLCALITTNIKILNSFCCTRIFNFHSFYSNPISNIYQTYRAFFVQTDGVIPILIFPKFSRARLCAKYVNKLSRLTECHRLISVGAFQVWANRTYESGKFKVPRKWIHAFSQRVKNEATILRFDRISFPFPLVILSWIGWSNA